MQSQFKAMNEIKRVILFFIVFYFNIKLTNGQGCRISLSSGVSINTTNFKWSIAGNIQGQSPNVLSELIFTRVTSIGGYVDVVYRTLKNLEINIFYKKNGVIRGTGTDTDYGTDNRTNTIYDESFVSNKGHLEVFKTGGSIYFIHTNKFNLKTGFFYNSIMQSFYILKPDFADLNSTYTAYWKGAKLSMGGSCRLDKKFSAMATLSYGLIKYKAEANWDLIDIFMHPLSFEQNSGGRSIDADVSLKYVLNSSISLVINGTIGNTRTYKGIDKSYLQNNTRILTQFNGSNNNFYEARFGAFMHFY